MEEEDEIRKARQRNGCTAYYRADAKSGLRVIPGVPCGPKNCQCAREARAEPIDLTPADPPRVPGWCLALGVGVLVVAFTAAIWRG